MCRIQPNSIASIKNIITDHIGVSWGNWCFKTRTKTWPSRSGRVVYSALLAACSTDGHSFKPQTSTNTCRHICRYVNQKGSAAMLTSIQSAGVTPEVDLRITQVRKHTKRIHPGFETQGGQMSPEVQNSISGPTKRTYVLQKLFKKKRRTKTWLKFLYQPRKRLLRE